MNAETVVPSRESNPFATCWTRPGALPYLPTAEATVRDCVALLDSQDWRGQIVGPHGAGKSTLLRSLRQVAIARDRPTAWLRAVRSAPRRWPSEFAPEVIVFIDSFEQLSFLARRAWLRRAGGLVVTTHRPTRLLTLAALSPSLQDARRLFALLTDGRDTPVCRDDLDAAFVRRQSDLREVWFDLYSAHEEQIRRAANRSPASAY